MYHCRLLWLAWAASSAADFDPAISVHFVHNVSKATEKSEHKGKPILVLQMRSNCAACDAPLPLPLLPSFNLQKQARF